MDTFTFITPIKDAVCDYQQLTDFQLAVYFVLGYLEYYKDVKQNHTA